MIFQNLWQIFIYYCRCCVPNRIPEYMKYNSDDELTEFNNLTQNDNLPYSFIVIRQ